MMETCTEIMVDKGFNILNEYAARRIDVIIPPEKHGSRQMMPAEITKTNNIVKTRILVEQVICRLKIF